MFVLEPEVKVKCRGQISCLDLNEDYNLRLHFIPFLSTRNPQTAPPDVLTLDVCDELKDEVFPLCVEKLLLLKFNTLLKKLLMSAGKRHLKLLQYHRTNTLIYVVIYCVIAVITTFNTNL